MMEHNEKTNFAMIASLNSEHNINMEDVVLELEFMGNGISSGPATMDQFKLDTLERYVAGSRPAKPAWTKCSH